MNTAERIYDEVKRLPEPLAEQVLDFVFFLEQRRAKLGDAAPLGEFDAGEIRRRALAAQRHFPPMDRAVLDEEFTAIRREWDRRS
ncbi:MAG: hypothetical protein HQL75_10235 [Magnetococcales bacterium]|nr:hypothetical protein [Magnetococcales bacterium]